VHLARLVELELVLAHRAERGSGLCYELCWRGEGRDGSRFVTGLLDSGDYDHERSGETTEETVTVMAAERSPSEASTQRPDWARRVC